MDSDAIRAKWDARYRSSHSSAEGIAAVLIDNTPLLPTEGKALDLASGLGANALYLAGQGLEVHAWDISPVAIDRLNRRAQQQGLTLHTQVRDCLARPPEPGSFDVIVVSRFLERELCPAITVALKPGGLLFYQTYTRAKQGGSGPGNPHFLLEAGELPRLFSELEVAFYREGEEALFVGRKVE
ncbi:MAG: methyltransferase domain-containing protein [Gammaproteobacteria bacterium]|nr:methyltransferase domain-containing protein [Gammaproteobacteria bacterium]